MTGQAIRNDALFSKIHSLATACLEGDAEAIAFEQLNDLVSSNPEALDIYVEYLDDSISLSYVPSTPADSEAMTFELLEDGATDISGNPLVCLPGQVSTFPLSGIFTNAFHGTIGYFSHEIPFSFLVGALLTGLLVLVAWLVPVSDPVKIANTPSRKSSVVGPKTEFVGQITGMADVKWADPSTEAFNGAHVSLGRRYALASGLLEITYHTGAKVILQGPVTYKVESAAGGFLSIGKLTARLDNAKPQAANHKSQIINQKSSLSAIHYPLFTIKTPTATVTDLGTEFGVEVLPDHRQNVLVFQGQVKVALASDTNATQEKGVLLKQGQAAYLEPGKNILLRPDCDVAVAKAFARNVPQPTPKSPSILNSSFEEMGFDREAPPKHWKYWVVEGDGRMPRVASDIGGMAPTATGKHMLQIICTKNSAIEAWQAANAQFVPGQTYQLTVAVGMRNDLRNKDCAAEADWKISLNHANAVREVACLRGTIPNDAAHTGFLRDQTLTYTATSADAGHSIEIHLFGSTVGKTPSQSDGMTMICMNFDNVRLIAVTASDSQQADQPKKEASRQSPGHRDPKVSIPVITEVNRQ